MLNKQLNVIQITLVGAEFHNKPHDSQNFLFKILIRSRIDEV